MTDTDPLDDRDADAQAVQEKRLREELDSQNESLSLSRLLEAEGVRDYLWQVVSKCGTLNEAFDPNFGKTGYNCGRQSIGRMIIADINLANPQAWLSMQLKAAKVAQDATRAESLKRLRKARST